MDSAEPTRNLIIAYGNPLRSDDGVGWHAAKLLEQKLKPSDAKVVCVHQLAPELAETASHADKVVFVDAACNGEPGQITCVGVSSKREVQGLSHQLSPEQVIALSQQIYCVCPRAFIVSIVGSSFDHGETLSQTVANRLPRLVERVRTLIDCGTVDI